MTQKKAITIALMTCCLITGARAQEQDRKVAVFDPAGDVEKSVREIVREEISAGIVNTGGYVVLERALINKVLEENKFQSGGLVDEVQISEIGKRLGADYVFVTSVSPLGKNYYISGKMIEVMTARIEKQQTASTQNSLNDLVETARYIILSMFDQNVQRVVKRPALTQRIGALISDDASEKRPKGKQKTGNDMSVPHRMMAGADLGLLVIPDICIQMRLNYSYMLSDIIGIAGSVQRLSYDEDWYWPKTLTAILAGALFSFPLTVDRKLHADLKPMIGIGAYEYYNNRYEYKFMYDKSSRFCMAINPSLRWNVTHSVSFAFSPNLIAPIGGDDILLSLFLGVNYHF